MYKKHSVKGTTQSRNGSSLCSRFSPVATACALLCALSAAPAFADNVYYTGNSADLQTVPAGYGILSSQTNALFPGTGTDGNFVTVDVQTGGTDPSFVFGGINNQLNAFANGNRVEIIRGTVLNDASGGLTVSESATIPATVIYAETVANEIIMGNGTNVRSVYGGNSTAKHVLNHTGAVNVFSDSNKVTLTGTTVREEVFGGFSAGAGQGSGQVTATAEDNTVVVGANSTVAGSVYGGDADVLQIGTGNLVLNASDNRVTISGGSTVNQNVFGGYGRAETYGTGTVLVTANDNTVTIADAEVNGNVYGGFVMGDSPGDLHTTVRATGNTVNITGNSTFSATTSIYGGFAGESTTGQIPPDNDVRTGNTLNFSTNAGISIKEVGNFQNYNFWLPASTTNGTTMVQTSEGADLTGSTVTIKAIDPGAVLKAGDTVYLLKTAGLTGQPVLTNSASIPQGYALQYDLTMGQNATDIYATVVGSSVNPKTKSFLEGRLAGLALVTQGADMVANQGMSSAIAAAEQQEGRLTVFGTVSGGTSRYDTGSHIDLDGFGLMAGVSGKQDNLAGAVFVEGGWGSYDSHNNFSNGSVKGDGDTHYYGVGLLGRATLKNGMYLDGSFRIGKTSTDYTGKDYLDGAGNQAHFKSKVTYVSAHAGVGYMTPLNSVTDLDVSAKYLWSRQGSDSVTVGSDPVSFDAENSQRLRGMAKVLRKVSPQLTVTGALGYEYEFDGKAKGTLYHMYSIDSPSLEGGSGLGEIGLEYKPQNNQRLSLEAKLSGYVGQREGIGGLVRMNYAF